MAANNRFSKILGPIKTVLPGIIVSLIGGTAGFLLFNNPGKIKGQSTWEAWNAIIQYEKIYDDNIITTTRHADFETIAGLRKYKNDVLHQIQMLSENFRNIKEESNVDNRLFAIINCKVDTYNQLHRMTDTYLDSVANLVENPTAYIPYENETETDYDIKIGEASTQIMNDYTRQRQHLIDRDSSTINNILQQLTHSYKGFFYHYRFTTRLPGEWKYAQESLYGSWEFLIMPGGFTFEKNNTGNLSLDDGITRKGKWTFDKDYQLILTTEAMDSTFTFTVKNISAGTIRLAINDSMEIIGFRNTNANPSTPLPVRE